jgi:hypothetical protein
MTNKIFINFQRILITLMALTSIFYKFCLMTDKIFITFKRIINNFYGVYINFL